MPLVLRCQHMILKYFELIVRLNIYVHSSAGFQNVSSTRAVILKPLQNKKGQSFIVMLGFCTFLFNLHQLPSAKKTCKNQASQQTFGHSYFVRALA